jgi:hypothetical protein
MRGWVDRGPDGKEYPGGVISSACALGLARTRIPADLADHAYGARFFDTTTASPLREDYNPLHPLSRGEDRANKMALLAYSSRELRLVTGSETGFDAAVPYLHYFEGMMSLGPYRLPDSGYDLGTRKSPTRDWLDYQVGSKYRIPLFELVYHDCVFSSWYWGDASNRLVEYLSERNLFNALYGTMPLWILDTERWKSDKAALIPSYANGTTVSHDTAWSELVEHRFLTADRQAQYTRFANGCEVWGNFDRAKAARAGGFDIPPRSFVARLSDGTVFRSLKMP